VNQIDIVLPCLNEAAALPTVLAALPPGSRAIVVDNGSTDGSAEIAAAAGALVVSESRRGFGSAAHAGLLAATAPLVAFCDADASLDPGLLHGFRTLVDAGEADLVLGARQAEPGAWPLHARLANRFLARRIRRATGYPLTDLGPLRLARREALLGLGLQDRRSGYPLEMVLAGHRAGWRVIERPVPYRLRDGKSKVTGTLRGTLTAVADMSRQLRAHAADRAATPDRARP
jgi:glycosyltransferase involved in cell wall biosynthesis